MLRRTVTVKADVDTIEAERFIRAAGLRFDDPLAEVVRGLGREVLLTYQIDPDLTVTLVEVDGEPVRFF